jgi:methyl-accepting chemotaxis protein
LHSFEADGNTKNRRDRAIVTPAKGNEMSALTAAGPQNLGNFFANLKIRTRVILGFLCVLAILAAIALAGFLGFSRVATEFANYTGIVNIASNAQTIERNLTDLRRHVEKFVETGDATDVDATHQLEKQLEDDIATGTSEAIDATQKQAIQGIGESLKGLVSDFDKVVDIENQRTHIAADILDVAGPKLADDFVTIGRQATQEGNGAASDLAANALYEMMKARLYANLMLDRHESSNAQQAEEAFQSVQKTMEQLDKMALSPALRSQIDEIKTLVASYEQAFQQSKAFDDNIETLTSVTIADRVKTITNDADAIKKDATADEEQNAEETDSIIADTKALSTLLGLGGLVLGLAIAWLIGRGISRPIVGMTSAMTKLAGGDKSITVPALGRKDEIGQMAEAVEVFKQNAIEMDRLAAEQRKEQERKEARQQAIEGYIKSFDESVTGLLGILASAATEMRSTAESMSATAEETSRQSTAVAAASEQASSNVQTVASAAEELTGSISEITRRVSESTQIAGRAVEEATRTNVAVKGLAEAAQKIGNVVQLINDIASQTNLLALNATIEAARAGEAGKGFAVVASEVKSLATQTAKATEEIAGQIQSMQGATDGAVTAIEGIGSTISKISEIATAIASAVEEQGAATQEIARNVQQAAAGTSEVSTNISGVTQAAGQTGAASSQVLSTAGELAKQSEVLRGEVNRFLEKIRAA